MTSPLPALFLSHGSPMVLFDDDPAHHFLAGLAAAFPKPKQILVISAHWETATPTISDALHPETIHDFGGFPRELHEARYPAPGAPDLAARVVELLEAAGISANTATRGLDHGAWVPLKLIYPEADIPVTQLAIQPQAGPRYHHALGRALRPLRDEGVLVVGSGSLTHNLHEMYRAGRDHDRKAPDWVKAFAEWTAKALAAGHVEDLFDYRDRAPFACENHPTEDHFLPLFAALGAGGEAVRAERLHASYTYGVLAMDAYAFS